jgi:hypothetical protein
MCVFNQKGNTCFYYSFELVQGCRVQNHSHQGFNLVIHFFPQCSDFIWTSFSKAIPHPITMGLSEAYSWV